MIFFLSKVIPIFLYPLGFSLTLLITALLLRRKRGAATFLAIAACAILALFASDGVSQGLMRSLESQVDPRPFGELEPAQAIVVLGGYLHSPSARHPQAEFTEAGDRLVQGMRLYRAGKAPLLLLTGGNIGFMGKHTASEAAAARDLLLEWGVPPGAIEIEDQSRNTRENATNTRRLLEPKGIRRILLVTSAFHMPRAKATFRKVGFEVTPAPTDFQTGWGDPDLLFRVLPDPENLNSSTMALKEWLGLGVYRLRGWI